MIFTFADSYSSKISIDTAFNSSETYSKYEVYLFDGRINENRRPNKLGNIEKGSETLRVNYLAPNREYSIGILASGNGLLKGKFFEHSFTLPAAEEDGN